MTNLRMLDRQRKFWLCALLTACWTISPAHSQLVPGTMDVHWNEGSEDCVKHRQPPIQMHRYNAQTVILRQSLCARLRGAVHLSVSWKNQSPADRYRCCS